MRKKTIKFYFFKNNAKSPSMNYLFCFSKRAIKQNKQLQNFRLKLKTIKNKKRKHEVINYINMYKNTVRCKININQWQKNTENTKKLYLGSFFTKIKFVRKLKIARIYKKTQLLLWFFFKKKFNRFILRFLKKYRKIGFLSSHFVHILSKKNLTYQTRSKYRANIHNLNTYNFYVLYSVKQVCVYKQILNSLLYVFATNSSKQGIWRNENHQLQTSNWYNNYVTKDQKSKHTTFTLPIEFVNFDNTVLNVLYDNYALITEYLILDDQKKKRGRFF